MFYHVDSQNKQKEKETSLNNVRRLTFINFVQSIRLGKYSIMLFLISTRFKIVFVQKSISGALPYKVNVLSLTHDQRFTITLPRSASGQPGYGL